MRSEDMGILNPWLRNIRDVYRIHHSELEPIVDEELAYKPLIELNVQEQCINVLKTADVQKAYKERTLTVNGWVFDIQTGQLIDLKIDFSESISHPYLSINLSSIFLFSKLTRIIFTLILSPNL